MLSYTQEWGLKQLAEAQVEYVIGIDEVGLGAIAGPLVVCGAVFEKNWKDPEVKDSKAYSGGGLKAHEKRCRVLRDNIHPVCKTRHLEIVCSKDIDLIGMGHALEDAMRRVAIRCTHEFPDSAVILDGNNKPYLRRAKLVAAIPSGDKLVPAVSAASVIAKTTRDALMITHNDIYPGYGFDGHMGYGTPAHYEAIQKLGLCVLHRRSYLKG